MYTWLTSRVAYHLLNSSIALTLIFGIIVSANPVLSQPPSPTATQNSNKPKQKSFYSALGEWWQEFTQSMGRQKVSTVSRGRFCILSPGVLEAENAVYSTKPLFIVLSAHNQTKTDSPVELSLNLYKIHSEDLSSQLVWNNSFKLQGLAAITYNGNTLEEGQIYDWNLITTEGVKHKQSFYILGDSQRETITRDIRTLETGLRNQGANGEEIALAKANYFVSKGLQSDALQELYLIKETLKEFNESFMKTLSSFCQE